MVFKCKKGRRLKRLTGSLAAKTGVFVGAVALDWGVERRGGEEPGDSRGAESSHWDGATFASPWNKAFAEELHDGASSTPGRVGGRAGGCPTSKGTWGITLILFRAILHPSFIRNSTRGPRV